MPMFLHWQMEIFCFRRRNSFAEVSNSPVLQRQMVHVPVMSGAQWGVLEGLGKIRDDHLIAWELCSGWMGGIHQNMPVEFWAESLLRKQETVREYWIFKGSQNIRGRSYTLTHTNDTILKWFYTTLVLRSLYSLFKSNAHELSLLEPY